MGMENGTATCHQPNLQGAMFQRLMQSYYPLILALGVAGNVANISVYLHPFLRTSPTVRLLSAKAAANLLHCVSLIPAFLYYSAFPGLAPVVPTNPSWIFNAFWAHVPWMLFFNNYSSTVGVWSTILPPSLRCPNS